VQKSEEESAPRGAQKKTLGAKKALGVKKSEGCSREKTWLKGSRMRQGYATSLGSLYEYQGKGDAGEGVWMSIKIKGIENGGREKLFELVPTTHSKSSRVFTKSQSKSGVY